MTRTFAALVLSTALSLPAIALAQGEPNKTDPDALVCKNQKKTGTRFATKICHTRKQWEEIAEANKRGFAESRDRPAVDISRDN